MKKPMLRSLLVLFLLSVAVLAKPSAAHADDMTCPPPVPVNIDLKPGNAKNIVKLSSNGVLAVAVLTTATFDAAQFTPEMAHLNDSNTPMAQACAGAAAVRWERDDENGDGRPDLVFFFKIQDLNFTLSTISATLMAHGSYTGTATHFAGADAVHTVP